LVSLIFAYILLTFYSCLSHLISFEFSFSNFIFSCFISWLPSLHNFGELMVLEVVRQEVGWFNFPGNSTLVVQTPYQEEKEGPRELFSDYFISKEANQHTSFTALPNTIDFTCNFVSQNFVSFTFLLE